LKGPKSLYSNERLTPGRGSPGTISVKFYRKVRDDQGTKRCRNIAENFNRVSRTHARTLQTDDRQTTDDRRTDDDI